MRDGQPPKAKAPLPISYWVSRLYPIFSYIIIPLYRMPLRGYLHGLYTEDELMDSDPSFDPANDVSPHSSEDEEDYFSDNYRNDNGDGYTGPDTGRDEGHDDDYTGPDTGRDEDHEFSEVGEQWENSSAESQAQNLGPNYLEWNPNYSVYMPDDIERRIKELTIPHLKAVLGKWRLPKGGAKLALVKRVFSHLMAYYPAKVENSNPLKTKLDETNSQDTAKTREDMMGKSNNVIYTAILGDLNDQYALCRHTRPFGIEPQYLHMLPELEEKLSSFEFDYSLPYPWIVEKKLTVPIVTDVLPADISIKLTFDAPSKPGTQVLIVAIRFKTLDDAEGKELMPFSVSPPQTYRHAYAREFKCFISTYKYDGGHMTTKIHTITNLCQRARPNEWHIPKLSQRLTKGYVFSVGCSELRCGLLDAEFSSILHPLLHRNPAAG